MRALPWLVVTMTLGAPAMAAPDSSGHPRLFFDSARRQQLRDARHDGRRALLWRNMMASADWCLQRPLRQNWIAPVADDPIYLNLYDRFYAMMHDMAVMEHLAFAYSLSGEERYREPARQWALTACRVWSKEADGSVDGAKAYAVMRLLKGLAVSYDLLYDVLTDAEREELRGTLGRIAQAYHEGYFTTPSISGPGFSAHHAIVEWASFGVAALAVLGEEPRAAAWLAATVRKFEDHLLPMGIAPDGAQTEGATFWGSTMQYRIMFMDALRNVTGQDLFKGHEAHMKGDLAYASVAAPQAPGLDEDHRTVIHEPSYGQLNYYAPVLTALAREYRWPLAQHLADGDATLGSLQQTRYVTPNGEWLLFDWGGYAVAWHDPTVKAAVPVRAPRSFQFGSVEQVYARTSYEPGAIVAGLHKGALIIHAGGRPVLVDVQSPLVTGQKLTDDGPAAVISGNGPEGSFESFRLRLRRPNVLMLWRRSDAAIQWWCAGPVTRDGQELRWPDGTTLRVTRGAISACDPQGFHDAKIVGMGKLKCVDPHPMAYPLVTVEPQEGTVALEVRCPAG